jgi:putative solute:sodium symporter small subunit
VGEDPQARGDARFPGRLPIVALLLWVLFAFVVPSFVQALNLVDVLAFPLGYFMAAQGALVAFVIIGVMSARRQDRRDARQATDI